VVAGFVACRVVYRVCCRFAFRGVGCLSRFWGMVVGLGGGVFGSFLYCWRLVGGVVWCLWRWGFRAHVGGLGFLFFCAIFTARRSVRPYMGGLLRVDRSAVGSACCLFCVCAVVGCVPCLCSLSFFVVVGCARGVGGEARSR